MFSLSSLAVQRTLSSAAALISSVTHLSLRCSCSFLILIDVLSLFVSSSANLASLPLRCSASLAVRDVAAFTCPASRFLCDVADLLYPASRFLGDVAALPYPASRFLGDVAALPCFLRPLLCLISNFEMFRRYLHNTGDLP